MYEVLERLMKEKGVKASEVAKETGIPSSVFTDWKKGRYTPKADKLYVLAKYFGVPMDIFFEPMYEKTKDNLKDAIIKEKVRDASENKYDLVMKLINDKDLYVLIERILDSSDEQREKYMQIAKLIGLM